MKVKVGDIVKFLNDVGGGKVTKILDKETALILNDTGFEVPVMINELLPDANESKYNSVPIPVIKEDKKDIIEEEPIYTDSQDVNFYLSFVPKDQKLIEDSDSDIYLINDSNYFVFYNYAVQKGEKYVSITGKLEPNVKENIDILKINSLQDSVNIIIQLIYYDTKKYSVREPVSNHLKIKSTRFLKQSSYKENDFFDELAIVIPVVEENAMQEAIEQLKKKDVDGIIKQKEVENKILNKPKEYKEKEKRNIKEVDLHIHELTDDEAGLSDNDKLQYQLDVFHKEMISAIKENYRRIVFIHGVGSGSLKFKIRRELQHKYKKYQFQDASFKEYGYGATMVLLRR